MEVDRIVPLSEVKFRLCIGRSTIYKLAGEGRIELVKIGTRTGVRESEVQRFLAALPTAPIRKCVARAPDQ